MSYPYGGYYPQTNMRSPIYQQPVPQMMPQAEQHSQPVQSGLKVIPVGSITEAQAVPTDFMGDTILMPDFGHGAIYMKVLNPNTGGAIFRVFKLEPEMQANAQTTTQNYDAKTEIDKLRAELEALRKDLGFEEEKKNV